MVYLRSFVQHRHTEREKTDHTVSINCCTSCEREKYKSIHRKLMENYLLEAGIFCVFWDGFLCFLLELIDLFLL